MEHQMNEMQAALAGILAWFHQFCTTHQLRYYMLGGTMLGAARHGGFIPWDDDIDVGMPRADFQRLERLMQARPSDTYVLETPNTGNPDFFYAFGKLYDTRTTLVENTRVPVKRGIFLDIFPLDGAGDTKEAGDAQVAPIKRRRALMLAMTTGIRKERQFYKNAAVVLAHCIPRRLLHPKKLLMEIQRISAEKSFDECAWVCNFAGAYFEREVMPRAVFGEPKEYDFEGMRFWGVSDYDTYLTTLYGNWRQLPPVEKRKTHHDFLYCDLHRSYLEE